MNTRRPHDTTFSPFFSTSFSTSFAPSVCADLRAQFSAYLNGEISGRSMASLAAHLDACPDCHAEFAGWRSMTDALAQAGRVPPPANLQSRLRQALHRERLAESHLTFPARVRAAYTRTLLPLCRNTLAPAALRFSAGLVIAASLLGGLTWMYAAPSSVEASDDNLAYLTPPRYLYSETDQQPIHTTSDALILIDAKINVRGLVYDYTIVAAPQDPAVRRQIEQNLLTSVFKPATLFGEPVPGHVMLTFTGLSVHG